jgi:protoporphyrinogen oxidase
VAARVSEPKRYRDSPDDPAGQTVLCAEIPCTRDDELWAADPAALAARLDGVLVAAGLPAVRAVEVVARHLPRVYPVYRPGYDADLATVEAWVDAVPRLVTFGRQGLFVADNTHHVLAMGRALATSVDAAGALDLHRWAAARAGFRDFVVED